MHLELHPALADDVAAVMAYYEQVGGPELATAFFDAFLQRLQYLAQHPGAFAQRADGLYRANLGRFPYHVLFRVLDDRVRVLVLRHHRRHPEWGSQRQ